MGDASFHRLILRGMGVRITAERVSLLVHRSMGGLQAPSVVESVVSAVASGLLLLLNGSSTASLLARDSLRQAMNLERRRKSAVSSTLFTVRTASQSRAWR